MIWACSNMTWADEAMSDSFMLRLTGGRIGNGMECRRSTRTIWYWCKYWTLRSFDSHQVINGHSVGTTFTSNKETYNIPYVLWNHSHWPSVSQDKQLKNVEWPCTCQFSINHVLDYPTCSLFTLNANAFYIILIYNCLYWRYYLFCNISTVGRQLISSA